MRLVLEREKSCKMDLTSATGKNCHYQDEEAELRRHSQELQADRKLRENKTGRSNSLSLLQWRHLAPPTGQAQEGAS